jgi:hypothetical protein
MIKPLKPFIEKKLLEIEMVEQDQAFMLGVLVLVVVGVKTAAPNLKVMGSAVRSPSGRADTPLVSASPSYLNVL